MNFVGHVFNVPISKDFEHVENVLHESITGSLRRESRNGASCYRNVKSAIDQLCWRITLAAGSHRELGHPYPP